MAPLAPPTAIKPVLDVQQLSIGFPHPQKPQAWIPLVQDISFAIAPGEIMGLVGESGCGKSLTSLAILGLLPTPGRILSGTIRFQDSELTHLSPEAYRQQRGNTLALIPQDPLLALNPVYTVGQQLEEVLVAHTSLNPAERHTRMVELFEAVQIPGGKQRLTAYPHEFSGGMRQRVLIAIALACNPRLLIADEPTTALDVTVQAEILRLIETLCTERDMACLFITHDMGVVAETCQRVSVMYAGHLVEQAPVEALFASPKHPYTQGLLNSIPRPGVQRLVSIEGTPPGISEMPEQGCRFVPRCNHAQALCRNEEGTRLRHTENAEHAARCILLQ
jgi:peptide/nickel transport system ATP-binding protein